MDPLGYRPSLQGLMRALGLTLAACSGGEIEQQASLDGGLVAPADLTASSLSSSSIGLAWSSSHSGTFIVERKGTFGDEFTAIADVGTSEYVDEGLAPATTYYYRVAAKQGEEWSEYSNQAGATTRAESSAPFPPTALYGWAVSDSEIVLIWNDNSLDETGFSIERDGSAGFAEIGTTTIDETSFHDTGLAPHTAFTYRVRATGTSEHSDYSAEVTVTTDDVADAGPGDAGPVSMVDAAAADASTLDAFHPLFDASGDAETGSDSDAAADASHDAGELDGGSGVTAAPGDIIAMLGGAATAVTVSGDSAYVGQGSALAVYDVADPAKPILQATLPLFATPRSIVADGDRLLLAAGALGVAVVDIAVPSAPSVGSLFDSSGEALDVVLGDDTDIAFVADGSEGLLVLDLTDGALELAALDTSGHALALARYGSTIYVADETGGLVIVDAAEAKAPVIVDTWKSIMADGELVTLSPIDVAIGDGPRLYVANPGDSGLDDVLIFDLSDPNDPAFLATVSFSFGLEGLIARGSYLYAIQETFSAAAVDMTDPETAVPMLYIYANDLRGLALDDRYAFVAGGYDGLLVVDMTDTSSPTTSTTTGRAPSFGIGARALAITEDRLYFADGSSGLTILDATPLLVSTTNEVYDSYDIAIDDAVVYVADGSGGLVLLDKTDTDLRIASATLPSTAYSVAVSDNYAYVAVDLWGALVVDVDPASDTYVSQIGEYPLAYARDVALHSNRLYVAAVSDGLVVLDLGDPTAPTLAGQYSDGSSVYDITIVEDRAYLACAADGVRVVDLGTTSPTLVTEYATMGDATAMTVLGTTGWIASTIGVEAVDLADPSSPKEAGAIDVGGAAQAVATDGARIYAAVPQVGLVVIEP